MNRSLRSHINRTLLAVVLIGLLPFPRNPITSAQNIAPEIDRKHGQSMLDSIRDDLESNYYDPTFHGMDLDARFKAASDRINRAASVGEIFGIIAQVLIDLDDSHTFFIPPLRTITTDYGWSMQIIGNRCFVVSVDKASDAALKGVKPGDEVLEAEGHKLERQNLWKFQYLYDVLRPKPVLHVTLTTPTGERRNLDLLAKTESRKKVINVTADYVRRVQNEADSGRDRFKAFEDQLLIWKMNEFDLTDDEVDKAFSRATKHKTLILDLRGNLGGEARIAIRVLSYLVQRDVKIADSVSRQKKLPVVVMKRSVKNFAGKLIVLVDSRSASASEVLARVVQLEKRGMIIGDQSAGAVMAAHHYTYAIGTDHRTTIPFASSITVSDLIMSDGNSLEHRGVMPDEVRLPTAEDLAAGRDSVMSYAASLAGVKLEPAEAGKFFPIEKKRPQ